MAEKKYKMGVCSIAIATYLLVGVFAVHADTHWKIADEGFFISMPTNWIKRTVHGIDSHVGAYKSDSTDLEFDGVVGLGYTIAKSQAKIDELKKKEANPKLLSPDEEVWHIDGKICAFYFGKADTKVYGKRRFTNVAELFVPFAGEPAYLSVFIFYQSEKDLPTVRQVLKSIRWKKKDANKPK